MKIRIRDNSIRLRLMQSEVKQLEQQGLIEKHIQFGTEANSLLTYRLEQNSVHTTIQANFINNCITVFIPEQMGKEWAGSNEVSLSNQHTFNEGKELSILIEKDFQCLTDRPGEDESDAFPNPNTEC